ncbi:MAG TPA: SpoIIE family protein phosphatase, partial [Bryobacterales bacterium]|nr:SpoIIE family protein phosphatase [Bryobacterales bacterium]
LEGELRLERWRLGRLEKAAVALVALEVLASLAERLAGRAVPGREALRLAAYAAAVYLLIKLLRAAARTLLWRVRNRMIVLFLFIGVVPLLLVAALVGVGGYILIGQAAVYMATTELDRRAGRLEGTAKALLWSMEAAEPAKRAALARTFLGRAAETWPGLEALVREAGQTTVFPEGSELEPPPAERSAARAIVKRNGEFYLMARASGATARIGEQAGAARSVIAAQAPGSAGPEKPAAVEAALFEPLSETYLAGLAPGLGKVRIFPWRRDELGRLAPDSGYRRLASETQGQVPAAAFRFDYEIVWGTSPFTVAGWGEQDRDQFVNVIIHTRPSAVYRLLFGPRADVASFITVLLIGLSAALLVVEMVSLVTGISITRTLTRSVHELYVGTQKVNRGDFSHRIPIGGHDQLAELARSFNSMTASIEGLIEESKERQRLESELAIAREVQAQLFPKVPPQMRGLEVLGVCNAARTVSGDYFDFVKLSEERLALAIGDVAGKGISGALLMASIQSMLRSQLWTAGGAAEGSPEDGAWRFSTSGLVARLNQQLYENTSPEKFATFFFGAYDDRHALLTYTNAGHLPPVLIRKGEPRRLEVNGLIVGAFPFAKYEQSEIPLEAGDVMVAFTDGVTEPENEFAEEFGEERLIEMLVRSWRRTPLEIIDEVMRAVGHWTGKPELQDDMTMVVARRL